MSTAPPTTEDQVEDFAVVAPVMSPGTPRPVKPPFGEQLLNLRDLYALPDETDWLLSDLGCRGELWMLYGDSSAGKSYLAVDLSMALACGVAWCGGRFAVPAPRTIVYAAGEGWRGLKKRFFALASEYGRNGIDVLADNLRFIPACPQLFDSMSACSPLEFVEHLARNNCARPDLVILDTLQRSSVGADENYAKDVGVILGNIAFIQRETGAAVLLVHHANKLGAVRGSTALRGSADVVLLATKVSENSHQLRCDKVKDADYFNPIPFSFYAVEESSVIDWSHEAKPANEGSAAERVLEFLAGHPNTLFDAKDIAFAVNIQPTNIPRAVKVLGKQVSTVRGNPNLPASKANPTKYQYAGTTVEEQPEASR